MRRTFTLAGKPVPPEVFGDMGDADMADPGPIRVTIDVKAAIGSNLYADPVSVAGGWVTQKRAKANGQDAGEELAYHYVGATRSGLLVVITSYSGGGSGVFYTLHILDAVAGRGFDPEGKPYDRINVTELRGVPLGDRWKGTATISGDAVTITTTGGVPAGDRTKPSTKVITALRP